MSGAAAPGPANELSAFANSHLENVSDVRWPIDAQMSPLHLACAILHAAKTMADAYYSGPPVQACDKTLATTPPLRDNGFAGTLDIMADCRQARMWVRGRQGFWPSGTAAIGSRLHGGRHPGDEALRPRVQSRLISLPVGVMTEAH